MKFKLIDLALRSVLYIHLLTYRAAGVLATMKEGNGRHPKHRIINYHRFFIDNIEPSDTVLDIGCGNGALTADIASKARFVTGIDINPVRIRYAKEHNLRENIRYFDMSFGQATLFTLTAPKKYDVIVLSNVLEHIETRIEFLTSWCRKGKKLLIRVPMLDRGWLPVYMKELGMDYRLDKEHKIEYTVESFMEEIKEAGLHLDSYTIKYGEILAVVKTGESEDCKV